MVAAVVADVVAADADELVEGALCVFSFFFQEIVVGKQGGNILGLVSYAGAAFNAFFSVRELHHDTDLERVVADFGDSGV